MRKPMLIVGVDRNLNHIRQKQYRRHIINMHYLCILIKRPQKMLKF